MFLNFIYLLEILLLKLCEYFINRNPYDFFSIWFSVPSLRTCLRFPRGGSHQYDSSTTRSSSTPLSPLCVPLTTQVSPVYLNWESNGEVPVCR